jgi:DNA-binding MarR family transcriptional regulator
MRSKAARAELPWVPPPTVSNPALLVDGSDTQFRAFVQNLIRAASQMLRIRESVAALGGMSAPRYAILTQIAQTQGTRGVSVRAVAEAMFVTAPFVVTEVGHLIAAGLVEKRQNPQDKRGVLLSLTKKGRTTLEHLAPKLRVVNDSVFSSLSAKDVATLVKITSTLVNDTSATLKMLEAMQT